MIVFVCVCFSEHTSFPDHQRRGGERRADSDISLHCKWPSQRQLLSLATGKVHTHTPPTTHPTHTHHHTHTPPHTHPHTHTHTHTHIYTQTHIHTNTHVYTHTHANTET